MITYTKIIATSERGLAEAHRRFWNYTDSCYHMGFKVVQYSENMAIIYTDYGTKEFVYVVMR